MNLTPRRALRLTLLLSALALATACGDDGGDGGGGGGSSSGEVSAAWEGYCVATFTEDYQVIDVFDDPIFTAAAGSRYLLSSFNDSFGKPRAEMFFLTSAGPDEFEIEADSVAELPLTSNCAPERAEQQTYIGVFKDVTVYADEELTQEACSLTEGTAMETNGGGFSLVGEIDLFGTEPTVYNVSLGGLSEMCDGITDGYVQVPSTQVFGTNTYLVPIRVFIGPAASQ